MKNVSRHIATTIITGFALAVSFAAQAADNKVSHEVYLERANALIHSYQHFAAVMALQEAIRLADDQYPSIYMRLAVLDYGLGMIPDAIAAGEKAVALAPQTKWYKFDLAKFYLVDKRYQQAKEQLLALLQIDPGFTLGYVYLGEVYLALGQKNMAWACLQWADKMGKDGDLLRQKLEKAGGKPAVQPEALAKGQPDFFRFIKVGNHKDADTLLKQIVNGKSFENLEMELQSTKQINADFGLISAPELDENIAKQLASIKSFTPPVVVQTGSDYRVMQKILPFDRAAWVRLETGAGMQPTAIAAATPPLPENTSSRDQAELVSTTTPSVLSHPTDSQAEAERPTVAISPPSAPAVEKDQATTNTASVTKAIEAWRSHWQDADADSYLACYSSTFVPANGMSLSDWRASRVKNLSLPSMLKISLSHIHVTMQGEDQATATFQQDYTSDRLQDRVIKKLSLRQENGEWKITKEAVGKTL